MFRCGDCGINLALLSLLTILMTVWYLCVIGKKTVLDQTSFFYGRFSPCCAPALLFMLSYAMYTFRSNVSERGTCNMLNTFCGGSQNHNHRHVERFQEVLYTLRFYLIQAYKINVSNQLLDILGKCIFVSTLRILCPQFFCIF